MENKGALLAVQNGLRTLHVWETITPEGQDFFDNFKPISYSIEGNPEIVLNVVPVGNEHSTPDLCLVTVPVYEHKTFFDALQSIGVGKLPSMDVAGRTRHYPFLAMVIMLAGMSKARRRGCAALIARKSDWTSTKGNYSVIATGVNGTKAGKENLCEDHLLVMSKEGVVHAEVNALTNHTGSTHASDVMYVTDSPCPFCLEHIRNYSAIRTIVFTRDYRLTDHMRNATDFNFIYIPLSEVEDYMQSAQNRFHNFSTN